MRSVKKSVSYTYWCEPNGMWLGYMNEYPDYMTQGHTLDELKVMLRDIYQNVADDFISTRIKR
jgi:predicted RNase H-like HicB family nuclease